MGETTKIAVTPSIQVGGSLFTPEQLGKIGSVVGNDAKIEMTPFKQIYIEIPLDRREAIVEELQRSGLEVYPAGFVTKSLIACNFCKGAEEAGLETARVLNKAIAGIETPNPIKVGYAGCALGTSEPLLKDIGVVKMRDTFDIYVGGEAKGLKASLAKLLISGLKEAQLVPVITKLIEYYKENAKGKEKFSKFVDRITLDQLKQIAG
ncbi:nitrite reductase [Brevibacillus agri]|uniref:nitrite reductase n=1 Tax=Brevibacillus TaxID=55080 RepID=UPI00203F7218|nr:MULTISPECIES: nitrite reductase [Brevibacillus]MCM3431697.1 nitrite reductase [Brevibacillus invocatus]MED1645896.1 nitrite reductase [Brevibacillus agri]MED1657593.1 nitrite reductase [Brevibacillus agri]MED1690085.1 nitrite reductase [Brevibacillus agri]MED1693998.1 nitrite reductase [Brevibacillus agri]